MATPIQYSTLEYQIQKMKSQNLIIADESIAKAVLSTYGYSSLVKSYREPYVITGPSGLQYRDGVTLEQVLSLYLLDKNLRIAVISSMLDLEEHIKSVAADVISERFGTISSDYLDYRKYRNKRKRKPQFSLTSILQKLRQELSTDKDPIHHCMVTHGDVPPWILFKGVYFSTIINFIDQFKAPEQDLLANKLYNTQSIGLPPDRMRMLLTDSLSVCNDYRNLAAHGGRIYNYDCSRNFRETQIFASTAPRLSRLNLLLYILEQYNYKAPFETIQRALNNEVNRHCRQFPSDVTYLGQILNINITQHQFVFVSVKSRIFHINPHCSGIQNAKRMELADAEQQGYAPCKRCVRLASEETNA